MKGMIRDSLTITVKELRQLSRDPVSLALTLVFPILLVGTVINIASAFGAPSYNIPIVVADLDVSSVSKTLVERFTRSRVIEVIELCETEERALNSVGSGRSIGAVVIPKGFGNSVLSSRQAFIVLATDNSKLTSAQMIRNAVNRTTQDLLSEFGAGLDTRATPIDLIVRPISGRPPSGDPILPGMLGMIIILGAFDDILNVITRERERGTFPRLLLTPANTFSIYAGKILSTLVLTVFRTLLMLVIFVAAGSIIRGNIFLIFLITSLIAFFTLSVGLVISTRVRSSSTLTVLEIAITFPLFQLSGSFNSRQSLAETGRVIASALPWSYGNEALRRVIYLGLGQEAIASNLIILFLSGLVMLPIALLLSQRTM